MLPTLVKVATDCHQAFLLDARVTSAMRTVIKLPYQFTLSLRTARFSCTVTHTSLPVPADSRSRHCCGVCAAQEMSSKLQGGPQIRQAVPRQIAAKQPSSIRPTLSLPKCSQPAGSFVVTYPSCILIS